MPKSNNSSVITVMLITGEVKEYPAKEYSTWVTDSGCLILSKPVTVDGKPTKRQVAAYNADQWISMEVL